VESRYELLGPVQVLHDGREIDVGAPQQCGLLGLLLLAEGRPLSLEQLVVRLWADDAPATAPSTVRTYLSRLRQLLPRSGGCPAIASVRGGYQLTIEPGSLDLTEFEQRVRKARAARAGGDTRGAVAELRTALDLWRGEPLAGARGEYVAAERERLERLRLLALQERIALDLELGRHDVVLPELVALTRSHPLEERWRWLHMLALYRGGQQADALRVYREVRSLLVSELGVEPGAEVRDLHERILRADPQLDLLAPSPQPDVPSFAPPPTPADETPATSPMVRSAEPPTDVLAGRLRAARARGFVGRAAERALFAAALEATEPAFVALFLHGAPGVGKSTLLRRLADDATRAGRHVVGVCGRVVGSSLAAFEQAAAPALSDPRAVLMIDSFERCGELEGWLRDQLLPQLPDGALAMIASRIPPSPAWRADPSWSGALRVCKLGDLSSAEADLLLESRGVPQPAREAVRGFVGGHPLALSLAADLARRADLPASRWRPGPDVIHSLLAEFIESVPSPDHRTALHICAHASVTTEQLLRAVMPAHSRADPAELFAWLRAQPFMTSGPSGLYPHDVVRQALDIDLRWRDPAGYEDMHRTIREYVLDRLGTGTPEWSTVEAAYHLVRRGAPASTFYTGRRDCTLQDDDVAPGDRRVLLDMTDRTEGPESSRIVAYWLDRQPEAFRVYRHRHNGHPLAFLTWLRLDSVDPQTLEADPVAAAAWEHARRHAGRRPVDHIMVGRHQIDPANYMRPSPINDLCQLRMIQTHHADRAISWSYRVVTNPNLWKPWMDYIGFERLERSVRIGKHQFTLFAHDWRAEPLEKWWDRHLAQELLRVHRPATTDPAGAIGSTLVPDDDGWSAGTKRAAS
jgi:DNA-binding SARP family transcriptional activator